MGFGISWKPAKLDGTSLHGHSLTNGISRLLRTPVPEPLQTLSTEIDVSVPAYGCITTVCGITDRLRAIRIITEISLII
ncbi:MAG: hypothetical protein ACOYU2_01990 [Nitrospirota bacterium]